MQLNDNKDVGEIKKALSHCVRKYVFARILGDFLGTGTVFFGLLFIIQVVFAVFPWIILPVLWYGAIIFFAVFVIITIIYKCFIHPPSHLFIADFLEKNAKIKPRWLSLALELNFSKDAGSEQLKSDVMRRARISLSQCPAKIPIKISGFKIAGFIIAFTIWGITSLSVRPGCNAFRDMLFSFRSSVSARVFPGNIIVPLNTSLVVSCVPAQKTYPSCRITITDVNYGKEGYARLLRPDSSGAFTFRLDSLRQSVAYMFSIGGFSFPAETISVAPPPSIYSMHICVTPPAYIKYQATVLREGQGNFRAFAGSRVNFSVTSSGKLTKAEIRPMADKPISLKVKGNEATCDISISKSFGYTFSLTDTFGQNSDSTRPFFIEIIPDLIPQVNFIKPRANKELSTALSETLWVEAIDDIGIRQCAFKWRKNTESKESVHSRNLIEDDKTQTFLNRSFRWDLSDLSLYPGDTVFYWAEVRDNYPFDSTHKGVSQTFWLRLPGFEEIHENLARQQNTAENAMESAKEKQEKLETALENLMQSTRGKEALTWEQKRIVNDVQEGFKAESDTLAKAVESIKKTMEQLKSQGLEGKELVDKMDKVKKALEEIAREYGDSLLFEKMKKNENADTKDFRKALENLKKMLPDLASRLENTLKYLEKLKRDMQLYDFARQAEKYGKEQLELSTSNNKESEMQKHQNELTKNTEKLLSDISEKTDSKDNGGFSKNNLPSLDKAQSGMQSMKNGLSNNKIPNKESMEQMGAELFSLAQELRDQQSSAMMEKMEKDKNLLMEMSRDALDMAAWQKEIEKAFQEQGARRTTAKAQQAVKSALLKSAEKMKRLSTIPPQTARQLAKQYDKEAVSMDKSIDAFKNEMNAAGAMSQGEEGFNTLAFSLMDMAGSMQGQNGEGGSGDGMGQMMNGFKRLSGKQAMINSATGQLLRDMLGDMEGKSGQSGQGGSGGKESEIKKAKKEARDAQQAIAEELNKLAEKYGKQAGNGLDKKAKDLEEEARRLAKMLENPDPQIQDRQQRFLSQMLQTTLSMHKQDEDKEKRQSKSAQTIFSDEIDNSVSDVFYDRDSFFKMRQKAFSGNYPESYRYSIKNYFDSLGVLFLKEK